MTKVLLVHEYGGEFGGAERYLELLSEGLQADGHDASALVFGGGSDPESASNRRMAALSHDAIWTRGRSRPLLIRDAVRRWRPDVVHWNFVDPFAFRGASLLLLPWGRPSVITDHLPHLRHAGIHWETTRRLANRRIGAMIVVGEAARAAAAERWEHPPPIRVVPNGVSSLRAGIRAAPSGPLRLLFVGRLAEQKGVQHLAPILEAVRAAGIDATLRVVGDGPLRDELADLDLAGFVDDPREAMATADVLLAPSAFEGLPFTLLEALSTGLPLVLSDIPPHAELADEATGLGVQVASVDDRSSWVAAVKRVAADLPAASRDALERAELHSLDRMVEQTLAVYADTIG